MIKLIANHELTNMTTATIKLKLKLTTSTEMIINLRT